MKSNMKKICKQLREWFYNRYGITKGEFRTSLSSIALGIFYFAIMYVAVHIFN